MPGRVARERHRAIRRPDRESRGAVVLLTKEPRALAGGSLHMRATLIHNPSAGDGDTTAQELVRMLDEAGISASYCSVKDPQIFEVLKQPAELVVVAGGDGTVAKVVEFLADRSTPIAILPLGTANNIARSLGIAGEPHELAAGWRDAHPHALDVGLACGPWGRRLFLESVGLGALAKATVKAEDSGAKGGDGIERGRKALRKVLRKLKAKRRDVAVDGRLLEDDLLLVEIMNIGTTGPNLRLAPHTDPGDGLLDVVTIRAEQRNDMLAWLDAPDTSAPPIAVERGRGVTIAWHGSPLRIGDYFPAEPDHSETVTIELQPEGAKVLLPPREEGRWRGRTHGGAKRKVGDGSGLGSVLPDRLLGEIERTAVELARLAGVEIVAALGGLLSVRYKNLGEDDSSWRDPVSEVDHSVELLIRTKLAERFPEHDILGEEIDERPGRDHDFVWAIDPIDGTTNFINGFPLFSASVGVLHQGRPIAGALWCTTSHALRAGVYHARSGGRLHFDEEPLEPKLNPAIRRRLAGAPKTAPDHDHPWENRVTGSAAIECAFVAAGLLRAARFERPNVWDVAGGIALVLAGGGEVRMLRDGGWQPIERFVATSGAAASGSDLRNWREPLILGESEAVALMCRG